MTFDEITGHKREKDILLRAISRRHIAHAYLFDGPEGIGKRLVATSFIRTLLCTQGTGCGHCPSCLKIDHNNHPDIHYLLAEGAALKVDQVRELQQVLSLRPLEGDYKICLVDGAEHFTVGAANALLKTLEEPQQGTIIILITSQPETLLTTIRSRCQKLTFRPLPKQQIAKVLTQKLDLNNSDAMILAALSEGSFKKALGKNQELFLEKRRKLIQSLSALSAGSIIPTFAFADELDSEKELLPDIIDIFQTFYRDILLLRHGCSEDDLVNIDLLDILHSQSQFFSTPSLMTKLKALESTRFHLQRNVNCRLALEVMLMRITNA
ncbi:DNA polymerase III, delta prime subunit [Desulfuromusa kysingii]|uniref:DNA polymerase III subunit delta' n=1 Tax=Desulfuromusa kysingii TaxID=37625 RepID=A0A1H4BHC8_9BACT|nr:DNA polymerase III subunit delta' [Desulfuromusa kysingii]SEA47454.1 DNA polymerase III, delta prime subunit [Desulfuromusa kysingii]